MIDILICLRRAKRPVIIPTSDHEGGVFFPAQITMWIFSVMLLILITFAGTTNRIVSSDTWSFFTRTFSARYVDTFICNDHAPSESDTIFCISAIDLNFDFMNINPYHCCGPVTNKVNTPPTRTCRYALSSSLSQLGLFKQLLIHVMYCMYYPYLFF